MNSPYFVQRHKDLGGALNKNIRHGTIYSRRMEVDPGSWKHYELWLGDSMKSLDNRDVKAGKKAQTDRQVWWRIPGYSDMASNSDVPYIQRWKWASLEYYVHAMTHIEHCLHETAPERRRDEWFARKPIGVRSVQGHSLGSWTQETLHTWIDRYSRLLVYRNICLYPV